MPASCRTVTGRRSFRARLERAQLVVDLAERAQLGHHQRIVSLSVAVEGEDETAEVAVGELAGPSQKANATAQTPAGAEPG